MKGVKIPDFQPNPNSDTQSEYSAWLHGVKENLRTVIRKCSEDIQHLFSGNFSRLFREDLRDQISRTSSDNKGWQKLGERVAPSLVEDINRFYAFVQRTDNLNFYKMSEISEEFIADIRNKITNYNTRIKALEKNKIYDYVIISGQDQEPKLKKTEEAERPSENFQAGDFLDRVKEGVRRLNELIPGSAYADSHILDFQKDIEFYLDKLEGLIKSTKDDIKIEN